MRALVLVAFLAGSAHADPCGDARAELAHGDLTRASIEACDDAEVAVAIAKAAAKKNYSQVSVSSDPDGATVIVEPAPDRPFVAPREVWLAPGRWTVTALIDDTPVAQTIVVAKDGATTAAMLDVPVTRAPSDGTVDMSEGGGDASNGPPPDVKFKSLLPDKYKKGLDTRISWIEKPLHVRRAHAPHWRLAAGAITTPGAIASLERRFDLAWLWQAGWVTLTPAAAVLYDGDVAARGDLTMGFDAELWFSRWRVGGAAGATVRSDRTLGPLATMELSHAHWSISLRGELHLGALLVGARW